MTTLTTTQPLAIPATLYHAPVGHDTIIAYLTKDGERLYNLQSVCQIVEKPPGSYLDFAGGFRNENRQQRLDKYSQMVLAQGFLASAITGEQAISFWVYEMNIGNRKASDLMAGFLGELDSF